MLKAEVECQECGASNVSQAERCGSCGSRLLTVDVTLQSGAGAALMVPGEVTPSEHPGADVSNEDTIDGSADGAPFRLQEHKLIGTMVGEYRVKRVIGEGGMGTVFAGEHPLIGKEVAIKVLKRSLSDDSDVVERFVAEAKAVNTIRHPNIVDIFAFGTLEDESQYFVMEHVAGQSLAQYVEDVETVAYPDGLAILRQVLDALQAAHDRGIVHRDIKPDNIYLGELPGGGFNVKLLDFGIAKFTEDGISTGHTRTGVPIGTPRYMSPEQCYGRDVDHRSDLYSLGVIMYQMFTGRPPFSAKSVYQLVDSHVHTPPVKPSTLVAFPLALERIILWCLEKDKTQRPGSVAELKEALLPVLEGLAAQQGPAPVPIPALPDELDGPTGARGTDPRLAMTTAGTGQATVVIQRGRTGLYAVIGIVLAGSIVAAAILLRKPDLRETGPQGPTTPAVMAGPVIMKAPDAAAARPKPDLVTLQFQVSPQGVKHQLFLNGKLVTDRLPEVPRHRTRAVKVKIVAPGYHTYEADWVPFTNLPIQVTLVKLDEPKPMRVAPVRPRWRPRRRPPVRHDMRPEARPTMGGFDML